MKRLIIFLVRKRLGLKKYEGFRFAGQKSKDDWYFFASDKVMKIYGGTGKPMPSSVSLNWLLDDGCEIRKINVMFDTKG